ncbi:MAG: hypothetical protein FWB86_00030 [Treponema sp.]|nr:hypothetical protein [Treponema sp.]MCL2251561.1 hypothetical protein [Treponema sp.]
MNGAPLLLLFIYSGFTINLLLQCALGIKEAVEAKIPQEGEGSPLDKYSLIKSVIVFLTIILLWVIFSKVIYNLIQGIFIYILLFPVSYLIYNGIEYLIFRFIFKKDTEEDRYANFNGGVTAVAVFLCLNLSNDFLETVVLSFGFIFGIFIVNLIIREIRKRASLEAVPLFLRGKPLVLITMGMLSLVFTSASLLLFRMIGVM